MKKFKNLMGGRENKMLITKTNIDQWVKENNKSGNAEDELKVKEYLSTLNRAQRREFEQKAKRIQKRRDKIIQPAIDAGANEVLSGVVNKLKEINKGEEEKDV